MHSLFQRVSSLLTVALSTLMVMAAVTDIVSSLHMGQPRVQALVMNTKLRPTPYGTEDGLVYSYLDADFSKVFTWNTKQVFLYVFVEYEDEARGRQEHVVWNHIIKRENKDHHAITSGIGSFYPVTDRLGSLGGKPFQIAVGWDIMPYVGRLQSGRKSFPGSVFPSSV